MTDSLGWDKCDARTPISMVFPLRQSQIDVFSRQGSWAGAIIFPVAKRSRHIQIQTHRDTNVLMCSACRRFATLVGLQPFGILTSHFYHGWFPLLRQRFVAKGRSTKCSIRLPGLSNRTLRLTFQNLSEGAGSTPWL